MLKQLPPFPVHKHKCYSALYRIRTWMKKKLDPHRTENPMCLKSGRGSQYLLIIHAKSALYRTSSGTVPHSSVSVSAGSVSISTRGRSGRISQSSTGPRFQTIVCTACPLESCMGVFAVRGLTQLAWHTRCYSIPKTSNPRSWGFTAAHCSSNIAN